MFTGVSTTDLAGGGGGSRRRSGIRSTITDLAGCGEVQLRCTGGGTGRSGAIYNGFRFAAPPGFSPFVWLVDDGGWTLMTCVLRSVETVR